MKVVCKANNGAGLRQETLRITGNAPSSKFWITLGAEYEVVGMFVWKGVLEVILRDDTQKPNSYPIELFDVSDSRIPDYWSFSSNVGRTDITAVWGYAELLVQAHLEGIFERDVKELAVFEAAAERVEHEAL